MFFVCFCILFGKTHFDKNRQKKASENIEKVSEKGCQNRDLSGPRGRPRSAKKSLKNRKNGALEKHPQKTCFFKNLVFPQVLACFWEVRAPKRGQKKSEKNARKIDAKCDRKGAEKDRKCEKYNQNGFQKSA